MLPRRKTIDEPDRNICVSTYLDVGSFREGPDERKRPIASRPCVTVVVITTHVAFGRRVPKLCLRSRNEPVSHAIVFRRIATYSLTEPGYDRVVGITITESVTAV